jgi:hypothetical protein
MVWWWWRWWLPDCTASRRAAGKSDRQLAASQTRARADPTSFPALGDDRQRRTRLVVLQHQTRTSRTRLNDAFPCPPSSAMTWQAHHPCSTCCWEAHCRRRAPSVPSRKTESSIRHISFRHWLLQRASISCVLCDCAKDLGRAYGAREGCRLLTAENVLFTKSQPRL